MKNCFVTGSPFEFFTRHVWYVRYAHVACKFHSLPYHQLNYQQSTWFFRYYWRTDAQPGLCPAIWLVTEAVGFQGCSCAIFFSFVSPASFSHLDATLWNPRIFFIPNIWFWTHLSMMTWMVSCRVLMTGENVQYRIEVSRCQLSATTLYLQTP